MHSVPNLPSPERATAADRDGNVSHEARARPELFDGVVSRRVGAYLVDVLIIAFATALAGLAFFMLGVLSFGLLVPALSVILVSIPLAYHTLLIGGPDSATVGMRMFGLEVRRVDGGRPGYPQAGLLTVVFYVTVGLTSWLVLLVAPFNDTGRTLHDYLCGTLVVNTARRLRRAAYRRSLRL
jgi:uncharacterized RDD family membrane protein YckC